MKVVLAGFYPVDPMRVHGGVEAAMLYLASGMREMSGVDLHIVAVTKQLESDCVRQDGAVSIHYLAEPRSRLVPNMLTDISRVKRVVQDIKPDVVHAHTSVGALAGISAGCPTVFTVHTVVHDERRYHGSGIFERVNRSLLDYLTKRAIASVGFIAPVSSYVAREYSPLARGGVEVIPNAVEDRFFRIEDRELGQRILFAGFIQRRKNVLGLVRAFAAVREVCPDAELEIAGAVYHEDYHREVLGSVRELGLEESVRFLGLLDQEELEKRYAEAAVIAVFSWQETFCLTISQGMAAGKAVVSSKSGGPSDLIEDGETGFLVDPGDERALASRLVELLSNSELRHAMGRKGREVARQRFSKEAVAARTLSVYRKVLEDNERTD